MHNHHILCPYTFSLELSWLLEGLESSYKCQNGIEFNFQSTGEHCRVKELIYVAFLTLGQKLAFLAWRSYCVELVHCGGVSAETTLCDLFDMIKQKVFISKKSQVKKIPENDCFKFQSMKLNSIRMSLKTKFHLIWVSQTTKMHSIWVSPTTKYHSIWMSPATTYFSKK